MGLSDIIGEGPFVKSDGTEVSLEDVASNKVVLLYFSAHWCPPCRQFTPILAEWYRTAKEAGKEVELIFVSSDRDSDGFKGYLEHMPWPAIPFAKQAERSSAGAAFSVRGIPALIVVNSSGELITKDGRSELASDPDSCFDKWAKAQ